jgi:hypothetical protein
LVFPDVIRHLAFTKAGILEDPSVTQQYFSLGLARPKKGLDSPHGVCVHNHHVDGSE